MARELKDVVIQYVSLVNKAANKKKFLIVKEDDGTEVKNSVEKNMSFIKSTDEEQRLVYGIVYEPNVLDAHDDFMTPEEITKAAHCFMENFRLVDANHDFNEGKGNVVESFVAPIDMVVNDTPISKGTWVTGIHIVDDETWELVKSGEITGLSMAGYAGNVVEKMEEKSIIEKIKSFFNFQKDFKQELENKMNNDLYMVTEILLQSIYNIDWNLEGMEKRDKVVESFEQAIEHLKGMTFEITKKEEDMTREETIEVVKEILAEINFDAEVKKSIPEVITKEDLEAQLTEIRKQHEETVKLVNELSAEFTKNLAPKNTGAKVVKEELNIDVFV